MADIKPIDPNDKLIWYREAVRYSLDSGSAPGLRDQREALSGRKIDSELAALDAELVELVMELPVIDAELVTDDYTQPLDSWWWHLDEIRNKTFPVESLPAYLRPVYHQAESEAI